MLSWLLDRLAMARKLSGILVATSDQSDDDAISAFCAANGTNCFRGSLDNVAERLSCAANSVNAKSFVRISGDSPLLDPVLVDAIVGLFEATESDLVTNVYPRTFPKGFSVEAIRVEALERARKMLQAGEEEHVTPVFYRNPDSFKITNFASGHDWGGINMSVDTAEDFALAEGIILAAEDGLAGCGIVEFLALRERCLEVLT
jgi:spore coat polysaccharide biosynthesis protein SpsF (cytidylyltransferase family)